MSRALSTALVVAVTTAATYLVMYFLVEPRLPVKRSEVPALTGLTVEQARAVLEARNLALVIDGERPDDRVGPGTLTAQTPLKGSQLHRGSEVHVAIAVAVRSPVKVVPRLVGLPVAEAKEALGKLGLRAGATTDAPSDTVPVGMVVASLPGEGAVAEGGTVGLTVSAGPGAQTVPQVQGKRLSKAREMLEQAGFAVGHLRYGSNDDYDQNVVLKQSPAANTPAPRGAKVDLVIND